MTGEGRAQPRVAQRPEIGRGHAIRFAGEFAPGPGQQPAPAAHIERLESEPLRTQFEGHDAEIPGRGDRRRRGPGVRDGKPLSHGTRGRAHVGEAVLRQVVRDERAAPAIDREVALCDQLVIGGLDRDARDTELTGEATRARKAHARSEPAVTDRGADPLAKLGVERVDRAATKRGAQRIKPTVVVDHGVGPIDQRVSGPCHRTTHRRSMRSMRRPVALSRMRLVATMSVALIVLACGPGAPSDPTTGPPATPVASVADSPSPARTSSRPSATPRATPHPAVDLGARLVATIEGIERPCAMANTATDVWVTGNTPSVLARVDPATNTVVSQTPMAGSACGIAVGPDGRLWLALLSIGRVVVVDPATLEIEATIDGLGSQLWDLKSGLGAIWVVDRSKRELLRIDPATAAIVAHIPIGPSGSGLAIVDGDVWVADDVDSSVRRIDPISNSVKATIAVGRGDGWFANDDRTLFVASHVTGSITKLEPASDTAGTAVHGSVKPLDGTVMGGRAYIPDGTAGTLVEVGITDGAITTVSRLEDAQSPFVAEVAFGDVWVLDFGGPRIWRISP